MIERIKARIVGSSMTVRECSDRILIYYEESGYPEDGYSIVRGADGNIILNEFHRDTTEELIKSINSDVIEIYAVAYAKKEIMRRRHEEFGRTIMSFACEHSIEEIKSYLNTKIDESPYSVGIDEYDKISLIFTGDKGTLYYHNKPIHLVQNASIKRCFLVIYNLVSILMNLKNYYDSLSEAEKELVSFDELSDRYILV